MSLNRLYNKSKIFLVKSIKVNKLKAVFICIILVIVMLGLAMRLDANRIKNNQVPIFSIKTLTYKDGGTTEYLGLGYKIIDYRVLQEGASGDIKTKRRTVAGTWFMMYEY